MTTIPLDPALFTDRILARHGAIAVRAFRYPTGVLALQIQNGAGQVVLLPYQGQQVWDAVFHGRRLTMETGFTAPVPTRDYLRTYGGFFLHCGGTSLGNPGAGDDHPLHGELPNIPFTRAELHFGQDDIGRFVDLTGEAEERVAFGPAFAFRPRLRLHEGASLFHLSIEVENLGGAAMPFFYLAHVNFRPMVGARITDAQEDDATIHIRPPHPQDSPEARAWHEAMARDPALHRIVPQADPRDMVLTLAPKPGPDGWTEARQSLGPLADLVAWQPADLPHLVRWMARHPGFQALGFALPATARPDGRAAALREGQVIWLQPGAVFATALRFGSADGV